MDGGITQVRAGTGRPKEVEMHWVCPRTRVSNAWADETDGRASKKQRSGAQMKVARGGRYASDGTAAQHVGLSHPEELDAGDAADGAGASDKNVAAKASQV